ncbi:MAG: hypothetical protein JKY01_04640 [Pseudomonadales bacterium]|nr:hypothetical protein [Pseudomonadales bacterium]
MMNTQINSLTNFSTAINQQQALAATLLFSSLCIGSFIGLQLDQYLDIACVVRGTCYGDDGIILSASLIHPMVFKMFFSSVVMIILALLLKVFTPFESLKQAGIISVSSATNIKKVGTGLIVAGAVFLLLSMPLMVYSLSV